jgi:GNAT superfamily N-acetyltransferase
VYAQGQTALAVNLVFVLDDFRKRCVGTQLIRAAMSVGKQTGVDLVVAGPVNNAGAVALYKSLGFEWADDTSDHMMRYLAQEAPVEAHFDTLYGRALEALTAVSVQ